MDLSRIRNFSIIAHVDHGKSTLADRLLEATKTIEPRKMRAQVLDMMDLERERGITIKMAPVRMLYKNYLLNLIDTPGHIDFSYEVSRALKAVEGVVLLVDAAQGVEAQTFTVLNMTRELGLAIIPVINKIDLPLARIEETEKQLMELLKCPPAEILKVSGKTSVGVPDLIARIIERVPPPRAEFPGIRPRALVFDFAYSDHRGVIVYIRVFDGVIKKGDELNFAATGERFTALEVGSFGPERRPLDKIGAGEIGYVITGIKRASNTRVGDTILGAGSRLPPFTGYREPEPVVWTSLYPERADDFTRLKQSLERLKLSDAALSFAEESAASLGRGFRAGFLGLLHLEIVSERLRREFGLRLIVTSPSIGYRLVERKTGVSNLIYAPHLFPEDTRGYEVFERWIKASIILPPGRISTVIKLFNEHEAKISATGNFGDDRTMLEVSMPLRELMRHFFDELKSASAGLASFSYEPLDWQPARVVRLDVLVNGEIVTSLSRIVSQAKLEPEAEALVERLQELVPRQLVAVKIQVRALGRIIASRSLSALRKDVTGYLYGGDITRKMKLRAKQKKGKKKMQARTAVNLAPEVFLKLYRSQP